MLKKTEKTPLVLAYIWFYSSTQRRKGAEVLQVERTQKSIAVDAVA
jgi:hypothetical protein